MITGIPDLIRRAIENVIRNAVHYTLVGTTVDVDVMLHSEEFGGKPDRALIVVVDHGPGVPDGSLKEIFRPFYRVDDARDREAGGVDALVSRSQNGPCACTADRLLRPTLTGLREGLMVRIWLPLPEQPITKGSR